MGRLFLDTVSETILNTAFFVLHFAGWGIRWAIATVFFLAVMAGAGYYVFMQAVSGGQHVQVPNIVGMQLGDASRLLAQQGLELGKAVQVTHETAPRDYVLAQRPTADRIVRTGRKVYPTVSRGSEDLLAPMLLKKDWNAAQHEITQAQFRVGHVARVPHGSPRDTVIGQDPPPGASIPNQGDINLLLSAGDESSVTFMPNLIGMTEAEVVSAVAGYGVKLERIEVTGEALAPNVVLEQDPAADSYLYPGQTVRYKIKSQGEELQPAVEYKDTVRHRINYDWYDHKVEIKVIDRNGNESITQTYQPVPAGTAEANQRVAGSVLGIPVTYTGQAKLEVLDNGQTVETYFLKDGSPPVPESAL